MSWLVAETAILILQAVRTLANWFVSFVVPTEKELLHAAALRRAGKGGHVEVVRRLLQRHGNVDCYFFGDDNDNTRTRKTTLLHMASRENHVPLLRALLVEHGANPNLPDCVTGASALATACALGHDDIVQLLLLQHHPHHTAVNRLDWNGDTALHAASRAGHARSVGLLLLQQQQQDRAAAADASLFVTNHQGQTPLACALQQGHVDVARLLVQHILQQQHDMSYFDEDDRQCVLDTMVHSLDGACSAGHTEVVRFILNHAEVQQQPRRIHEEALFLAASQGHDEIVRLLLLQLRDNEKCVRATDDDAMMSRTMNAACRNGHAAVVRLLLAHNGNSAYSRYCCGHHGTTKTTPLHCAAQGNHADIVQLLLQHDKQQQQQQHQGMLNARDDEGQTALHTAAKLGNGPTVRTLLLSGANSMICDDKGHLALELAAACCCTSSSSDDDDNDNCGDRRRLDAIYALVREEPHNIRFNHHR